METRVCTTCNQEKEIAEFSMKTSGRGGRATRCKVCSRLYNKQYYKENSEKLKKDTYEYQKKRREILYNRVRKIKEENGCCNCDETVYVCLDFHHLESDEKETQVSTLIWKVRAWSKILSEIKKCIILCSNCHRKLHAGLIEVEPKKIYLETKNESSNSS